MTGEELDLVLEAQEFVEAGAATWETGWRARSTAYAWECPCGHEPPKPGQTTTPFRTLVALREPWCPFCGKASQPEWRR